MQFGQVKVLRMAKHTAQLIIMHRDTSSHLLRPEQVSLCHTVKLIRQVQTKRTSERHRHASRIGLCLIKAIARRGKSI